MKLLLLNQIISLIGQIMIENININEFINEINSLDKNNIEFKNKENY